MAGPNLVNQTLLWMSEESSSLQQNPGCFDPAENIVQKYKYRVICIKALTPQTPPSGCLFHIIDNIIEDINHV